MRKPTAFLALFLLTVGVLAQTLMPAYQPAIVTNADATVRCLATGTTTVPTKPMTADTLVVQVDPDSSITTPVLLQMTNDGNTKPTSITTSTAHCLLYPGDVLPLTDAGRRYAWDARHLFVVGPSGAVVRLLRVNYRTNTTPQ